MSLLSREERRKIYRAVADSADKNNLFAQAIETAAIAAYKAQQESNARAACDQYIESLGGAESNAWHDAPVDGVFIAGFQAGALAQKAVPDRPTESMIYRWFQESTIKHHIDEDGNYIRDRAAFIANKAFDYALSDRCPSHEGDQLSTLKAHGLAEGE